MSLGYKFESNTTLRPSYIVVVLQVSFTQPAEPSQALQLELLKMTVKQLLIAARVFVKCTLPVVTIYEFNISTQLVTIP